MRVIQKALTFDDVLGIDSQVNEFRIPAYVQIGDRVLRYRLHKASLAVPILKRLLNGKVS